jgi:hypothetical protein
VRPDAVETATIPETVTVPGQVVYDAVVKLTAAKHGMLALAGGDTPIGDEFGQARYRLFEAAFGELHVDDDLTMAPLAQAAETEANALLRECIGLAEDA